MATGNGWYLIGPLVAVGLVGFLGALVWRLGLQWTLTHDQDTRRDPYADGLAIFAEPLSDPLSDPLAEPFADPFADLDDFGLLAPAALTVDPEVADDIRRLLRDAGIRATQALRRDGRTAVLVFAEELEEARRLVGGSPAL